MNLLHLSVASDELYPGKYMYLKFEFVYLSLSYDNAMQSGRLSGITYDLEIQVRVTFRPTKPNSNRLFN